VIKNILFDLGGVLIDWNPKYFYRKIFQTEEAVDYFLKNICTFEWNEEQDRGRTIAEAEEMLISKFPEYASEIKMYYSNWEQMLGGSFEPSVSLLNECINDPRLGVFALTNWSAETWPKAKLIFNFLNTFDGVLVSGQENLKKPDPSIFHLVCKRFKLEPSTTLFIDDNKNNIKAATDLGFQTIHFTSLDKVEEVRKLIFHSL
jgi:2-haloacid dehalogenase